MESVNGHKENIKTYSQSLSSLKENIYNSLKTLISELTEGHTEGNIFPVGESGTLTLDYTKFALSHIYYNKKDDRYEIHIANCMNAVAITKLPAEEILQIYSTLYYADISKIFG